MRGDVETVLTEGRWVNRLVGSSVVLAVAASRAAAIANGVLLARARHAQHQVVYAQDGRTGGQPAMATERRPVRRVAS